jgi:hypothetical protein
MAAAMDSDFLVDRVPRDKHHDEDGMDSDCFIDRAPRDKHHDEYGRGEDTRFALRWSYGLGKGPGMEFAVVS